MTVVGLATLPRATSAGSRGPSDLELRALRALRRAGSLGILHQHLLVRMRPGRPANCRAALDRLESGGLIARAREARYQNRAQSLWRITDRGRAVVGAHDLPPAA